MYFPERVNVKVNPGGKKSEMFIIFLSKENHFLFFGNHFFI